MDIKNAKPGLAVDIDEIDYFDWMGDEETKRSKKLPFSLNLQSLYRSMQTETWLCLCILFPFFPIVTEKAFAKILCNGIWIVRLFRLVLWTRFYAFLILDRPRVFCLVFVCHDSRLIPNESTFPFKLEMNAYP